MSLNGPRLASETVTVTANHPYLMEDGTWKGAGQLQEGDRLQGASGPLIVKGVTFDAAPLWVLNFEVADDHTYAAGELEAWVHNNKNDKFFGLPKAFWNWYHRCRKRDGDSDMTKEEAMACYTEWCKLGQPGPDNKGRRGGGRRGR